MTRLAAPRSTAVPTPAARDVRASLTVTCLATVALMAAYTMPMLTLAPISADLGAGPTAQTWLISAVNLGLGMALLPAGTIADNLGRRRVFVIGLAGLAVGTALCGGAWDPLAFIAGRALQGISAAAVLATSLAIIAHATPVPAARIRATATWGAMIGVGIGVGPLLVGLLTELVHWRAGYVLVAVVFAVLVPAARRWTAESRADHPRPIDVPGIVTSAAGIGALLGLVSLRGALWSTPLPLVLAGAALVLLTVFVIVERRGRDPLLPPELFRRPAFLGSLAASWMAGMALVGLMSFLPTVLQLSFGTGVLATSLYFLAWSGTSALVAVAAPRVLGGALAARAQVASGLVLCAVGHGLLVLVPEHDGAAWVLPGLLVAGVGMGLINANLGRLAVETAPDGRSALGSGVSNTARYVGSAIGLPVVILLVTHGAADTGLIAGMHTAALVTGALALVGALVVALATERRPSGATTT